MIMLALLILACALVSGLEPVTAGTCFKIKDDNKKSLKHLYFIFGIFFAYFLCALLFKFGALYIFYKYFHQPGPWNYGFEMLLGVAIIYYSLKEAVLSPSENPEIDVPEKLSPLYAVWMGMVSIFNHLPGLLPLFIIIEKIDKLELTDSLGVILLLTYSALAILPLSISINDKGDEESIPNKLSTFIENKGFVSLHYFLMMLGLFMMVDSLGFIARSDLMS